MNLLGSREVSRVASASTWYANARTRRHRKAGLRRNAENPRQRSAIKIIYGAALGTRATPRVVHARCNACNGSARGILSALHVVVGLQVERRPGIAAEVVRK